MRQILLVLMVLFAWEAHAIVKVRLIGTGTMGSTNEGVINLFSNVSGKTDPTKTAKLGYGYGGSVAFMGKTFGVRIGAINYVGLQEESAISDSILGDVANVTTSRNNFALSLEPVFRFGSRRTNFYIGGGATYHFAKLKSIYDWDAIKAPTNTDDTLMAKGSAIGGKGFIGLDKMFGPGFGINLEVGYLFAKVTEYKTEEDFNDTALTSIGSGGVVKYKGTTAFDGTDASLSIGGLYANFGFTIIF